MGQCGGDVQPWGVNPDGSALHRLRTPCGGGLQTTRGLGDYGVKGKTHEPDVFSRRTCDIKSLVIATDGLWDKMKPAEVAARLKSKNKTDAASLAMEARARWTSIYR